MLAYLVIVGLASLLTPIGAVQRTVCSDAQQDCDYSTINAAINASQPNDIILVRSGVYSEPSTTVAVPLTIMAEASGEVQVKSVGTWLTFAVALVTNGTFHFSDAGVLFNGEGTWTQNGDVTFTGQLWWCVYFKGGGAWIQNGYTSISATYGVSFGNGGSWTQHGNASVRSGGDTGIYFNDGGSWTQNGNISLFAEGSTGIYYYYGGVWRQNGNALVSVSGVGGFSFDGGGAWIQNGTATINVYKGNAVEFTRHAGVWVQYGDLAVNLTSGVGVLFYFGGGTWTQAGKVHITATSTSVGAFFSNGGTWNQTGVVSIEAAGSSTGVYLRDGGGRWTQSGALLVNSSTPLTAGVRFNGTGSWTQEGPCFIVATDEGTGVSWAEEGGLWDHIGTTTINVTASGTGVLLSNQGNWTQSGEVLISVVSGTGVQLNKGGNWTQAGEVLLSVASGTGVLLNSGIWTQIGETTISTTSGTGVSLNSGGYWTQNGNTSINTTSGTGVYFNRGGYWLQVANSSISTVSGFCIHFNMGVGTWHQVGDVHIVSTRLTSLAAGVYLDRGGIWTQNGDVFLSSRASAEGIYFIGEGGTWTQNGNVAITSTTSGGGIYLGGGGNWTQNGYLSIRLSSGTGTGIYLVGRGQWAQEGSVDINITAPKGGQGVFFSSEATWLAHGDVNISCTQGSECMCEVPMAGLGWAASPQSLDNVGDQSLVAQCLRCPTGQYSLDLAKCSRARPTVQCHDCPNGADCSRGGSSVYSLASYWCGQREEDASSLECTACPNGYCVDNAVGPWDQACISSRQGTMCGECVEGHSEAFGTYDCVPDSECSGWRWLLPGVFVVGLLYVLLVLWLPIYHHPLWKSIIYFMQTVPLISSPQNVLLRATVTLFALDPSILGIHVQACPWPGLTAVQKMALDYVIPAILLADLALVLGIYSLFHWLQGHLPAACHRPRTGLRLGVNFDEDENQTVRLRWSGFARYTGALMALLLLMYEGVVSATMDLLNCVSWDGELRLLRAATVQCYVEWQHALFVVLGLFLVPFPLLLVGLRWLLHRKGCGKAVLRVLEGPYAQGRKWWESVGMLRRLALLIMATFIPNPIWSSLGLAVGCFLVLLSHIYYKPYADHYYGSAETLFLCDLALVALLQIPQSTFATVGQPFEGAAAEAIFYLQEALTLLPLVFCAYVIVRKYGQPLVRRIQRGACGRDAEAAQPTAEVTLLSDDDIGLAPVGKHPDDAGEQSD